MKKSILISSMIIIGLCTTAIAQDKVVVIPLNSSKVAGTNGQLQYNDNGTTAGAEVYYDKATGNLGIGTNTPTGRIEFQSEGSTPSGVVGKHYADNSTFSFQGNRALGTKLNPLAITEGKTITGFTSNGYDGDTFIPSSAILSIVDGPVSNGKVPGAIRFYTMDNQGNYLTRMTITNEGKLGLGTLTPSSKLEVRGEIRTTDSNGNNRLWGQGRKNVGVESAWNVTPLYADIEYAYSDTLVSWNGVQAGCPSTTWVCSYDDLDGGTLITIPDYTRYTADGKVLDTIDRAWVADRHPTDSFAGRNRYLDQANRTFVSTVQKVWCCRETVTP